MIRILTIATLAGLAAFASAPAAQTRTPVYGYTAVNSYPHDPQAFTQGLIFRDGFLYESTGLNGRSSVRKVRLETGEVLRRHDVDSRYFADRVRLRSRDVHAPAHLQLHRRGLGPDARSAAADHERRHLVASLSRSRDAA